MKNYLKENIYYIEIGFFLILLTTFLEVILNISNSWIRIGEHWRFLIIPISFYMVFSNKNEIFKIALKPDFISGYFFIFLSYISLSIWKIAIVDFFAEIGILLFIVGLVFLIYGRRYIIKLSFPLVYLTLITTIFERIFLATTVKFLQYGSAIISTWLLNVSGWTVFRNGLYIQLSNTVLQIETVCSGVNQLTALIAIAVPLSYLRHKNNFQRIILIVSTIPIALLFNSIRIFFIGIWNYNGLKDFVHGPNDILLIPVIYPFAMLLLFIVSAIISTLNKDFSSEDDFESINFEKKPIDKLISIKTLLPLLLMSAVSWGVVLYFQPKTKSLSKINYLPLNKLKDSHTSENNSSEFLNLFSYGQPDSIINKLYITDENDSVFIYVGYFNRQNVWKRIFSKGNDWKINNSELVKININDGKSLNLNYSKIDSKSKIGSAYYWYSIDEDIISSPTEVRKKSVNKLLYEKYNSASLHIVYVVEHKDNCIIDNYNIFMKQKLNLNIACKNILQFEINGTGE